MDSRNLSMKMQKFYDETDRYQVCASKVKCLIFFNSSKNLE
jgi:hypothetical protein